MVKREKYLSIIRGFYDSDLVKIITGVRRCGKSVILKTIMEEISLKSDNIIYVNFESIENYTKLNTALKIINYVREKKKNGLCYCFFDEVQETEEWYLAVRTLRLENCSIFITGSNSKLLSSEFITYLSGRYVSFKIRPFIYKEILEYNKEYNTNIEIDNYIVWGGFPGRFLLSETNETRTYLSDLVSTIIIKDLIIRYKIRKKEIFTRIVNFIIGSNSRVYSLRSIHNYLKNDFPELSVNTIAKYLYYLKEAYIIDEIPQYSTKKKSELKFYGKIYDCDIGLNSVGIDNNRYDFDHNLENIVYNELVYMGYSLKVYRTDDYEIDFFASKGNKTYLIQVAYSVVDDKAYNREMKPFAKLDNAYEKILITNDLFDYSTSTVRHIKLKDFLLMEDL